MKKILLIGDSIRMGYDKCTKMALKVLRKFIFLKKTVVLHHT